MSRHASSRDFGGRPRWGLYVPAAGALAALLSLASAGPDKPPASQPAPPVAQRVLAELQAANAARRQLLQAEQDWALETERLELLESTVVGEAARLKAAAAEARREAAKLTGRAAGLRARQQRLEEVEAMVDAVSERLEKALEALAGRSLPGLVPPDRAAGITDPSARLSAAVDRLGQAEQQARKPNIELVVGALDGEPMTVKLLRAGGVAAWWTSLDGKRAGQAALTGGKLILTAARTPADAEAIRKAFAIAEGRAAPAWVLLPVHPLQGLPGGGERP